MCDSNCIHFAILTGIVRKESIDILVEVGHHMKYNFKLLYIGHWEKSNIHSNCLFPKPILRLCSHMLHYRDTEELVLLF